MKKCGIFVMLFSLFLLTGCGGNKVTCSGRMKQGESKTQVKITATLKDNKVVKMSTTTTFDAEDDAKSYCNSMTEYNKNAKENQVKFDFKCNGSSVTVNDSLDGESSMSKDDFIEAMENQALACK